MKLKGVIFDMDGTLLDSLYAWEEYKRYIVTEALGYYEKSINVITQTSFEVINELKSRYNVHLSPEDIDKFAKAFLKKYYENDAKLKDGVREFLEVLSQNNIKMALATATKERISEMCLKHSK